MSKDDLKSRHEAALARQRAAEERSAARQRPLELEEVLSAEKAAVEAELIDRLEAEHGERDKTFRVVRTLDAVLAVKRPHHLVYRQFVEKAKTTAKDLEQLVMTNLLYPTKQEATIIFETEPHALVRCADAVCYLAGVRRDELSPK